MQQSERPWSQVKSGPSLSPKRIKELFEQALALNPSERAAFLDDACGNPSAMRAKVNRLLQFHQEDGADEALDNKGDDGDNSGEPSDAQAPPVIFPALSTGSSIDIGAEVQSYRICEKIGEGGMGVVYAAEHRELKHRAVVKVLRRERVVDRKMIRRFINEAKAAAKIDHPGIVKIMDAGRHGDGELYILMEHLNGESLHARLKRRRRLPVATAMSIARQVARALEKVHAENIVHRDLKPANVLLVPDDEVPIGERAKLLDFGIAKLHSPVDDHHTHAELVMGTPPYMPPEQWQGAAHVDARADLYALGIMMFEMMCGCRPFRARCMADWVAAHKHTVPPLVSMYCYVPTTVDGIVARLLAKRPEDRFESASDLLLALNTWEHGMCPGIDVPGSESSVGQERLSNIAGQSFTTMPAQPEAIRRSEEMVAVVPMLTVPQRAETTTAQMSAIDMTGDRAVVLRPGTWGRMRSHLAGWERRVGGVAALLLVASATVWMMALEPPPPGPDPEPLPVPPELWQVKQIRNDLSTLFEGKDEEVQRAIIIAIRDVGTDEAGWILYLALERGTPSIRRAASAALRDLAWPEAAAKIRASLRQAGGDLQIDLTADLLWLGDREGIAILSDALNDGSGSGHGGRMALVAAESLAKAGSGQLARPVLASALDTLPPGSGQWLRAARGLLLLGDKAGRTALTHELARPERERGIAAAAVLADAGDSEAIAFLSRVMVGTGQQSGDTGDRQHGGELRARADAALALARVAAGRPQEIDRLLAFAEEALMGDDAYARQVAVTVLGRLAKHCDRAITSKLESLAFAEEPLPSERDVGIAARVALLAVYRAHADRAQTERAQTERSL